MSPLRRGICTGQGHKTGFSEARGNRIGNSGAVDAEAALFHHLSKRRPTMLALARAILGRSSDIPTVCDMMARRGHRADSRGFGQLAGETAMEGDSSDSRASQMLKHAVGMVAAAGAYKGLQLTWKQVTGGTLSVATRARLPLPLTAARIRETQARITCSRPSLPGSGTTTEPCGRRGLARPTPPSR